MSLSKSPLFARQTEVKTKKSKNFFGNRKRPWLIKGFWLELGWTLLYLAPALLILGMFSYLPFFRSLWLSVNVTDGKGSPVRFNGLAYYTRILNLDNSGRDEYLKSIGVTLEFAGLVVPASIVAGVMLAVLAGSKIRGISFFRTTYTSSVSISLTGAGVVWALLYSPNTSTTHWLEEWLKLPSPGLLTNATTALPAVALMTIWASLGFNFIVTLAGIQAIRNELYESGRIDGTNSWTAFRYITLPLLAPTLLFLLVINTIQSFQAFTQFKVLMDGSGPEGSTNSFVYATYRVFWYDNRYGFASAMSVVLFGLLLALTLIQFLAFERGDNYQ